MLGRKWYSNRVARRILGTSDLAEHDTLLAEDEVNHDASGEVEADDDDSIINGGGSSIAETIANEANLFDVFLTSCSWISDGVVRLFLAAATSALGYILHESITSLHITY